MRQRFEIAGEQLPRPRDTDCLDDGRFALLVGSHDDGRRERQPVLGLVPWSREPHGDRAGLLALDVVDYCRVVARRVDPDVVSAIRDGDVALLDDLLKASSAFAV